MKYPPISKPLAESKDPEQVVFFTERNHTGAYRPQRFRKRTKIFVNIITSVSSASSSGKSKLIKQDTIFKEGAMGQIHIVADENYPGEGIRRGFARGLLVQYQDCNLTHEGMGIGSIALRDHNYTHFSRSWTDSVE